MITFIKRYKIIIIALIAVVTVLAIIQWQTGRPGLGPDGKFGWWDGNIWGSENSQRVADAYSLTHIIHGLFFYFLLWLIARRVPARYRFLIALILEASWELFENTSFVINRYRETIAQGYYGDSILNSCSDVVMMSIGFYIANRIRAWKSFVLFLAIELLLLWWVRDNFTLNLIMLAHPIEAIKTWQSVTKPPL